MGFMANNIVPYFALLLMHSPRISGTQNELKKYQNLFKNSRNIFYVNNFY